MLELEFNLSTSSLSGYAIAFSAANYFDTCELWSKGDSGQYVQINKFDLEQITTYKLRIEDMNNMGTANSIKFIFKGNENVWRNRSSDEIMTNIRLSKLVAWDSQNIGYVPNADNMMIIDSENGKPYKITVENGAIKVTEIKG